MGWIEISSANLPLLYVYAITSPCRCGARHETGLTARQSRRTKEIAGILRPAHGVKAQPASEHGVHHDRPAGICLENRQPMARDQSCNKRHVFGKPGSDVSYHRRISDG
jgi:hypothetical protein